MKVAIPTFGHRVSPRFDCAPTIVIVDVARGQIVRWEAWPTLAWGSNERIQMLIERRIDTVVCGGVDRVSAQLLADAGITVHGGVSGESERALMALLEGGFDRQAADETAGG